MASTSIYTNSIISTYSARRDSISAKSQQRDEETEPKTSSIMRLVNLGLIGFVLLGFGLCSSLFSPFFPTEAAKRGVSTTVVGMIFGTFTLVMFLGSLLSGLLVRKLGLSFMIWAGTLLSGGATVIFGLLDQAPPGDSYVILCFATRFVEGIGASLYNIAAYSIVATMFPKSVSTSYAVLETCVGAGYMIGPTIGGALFSAGGFSLPFYVVGAMLLAVGFLSMILLRLTLPPEIFDTAEKDQRKNAADKRGPSLPWSHFYRVSPEIWILSIAMTTSALILNFPSPTLSLYFAELGLTDTVTIGLVFLGDSLAYTLLSLIVGKLADTFSNRVYEIMALGALLVALSFLFIGPIPPFVAFIEPSVGLTITAYIINAIGVAIIINPTPAAIFAAAKKAGYQDGLDTSSMCAGLYNATWYLGSFSGNPLAGLLMDTIGFRWGSLVMSSIGFMLVIILCIGAVIEGFESRRAKSQYQYALFYDKSTVSEITALISKPQDDSRQ